MRRQIQFFGIWSLAKVLGIGKVVGLTGFVIIPVFIASFSPARGERNQMVNTKFTRPVNAMPMSTPITYAKRHERHSQDGGERERSQCQLIC